MNYDEMFVKIAFISFRRKLEEHPISDVVDLDDCLEKVAQTMLLTDTAGMDPEKAKRVVRKRKIRSAFINAGRDLKQTGKDMARNLGDELRFGGRRADIFQGGRVGAPKLEMGLFDAPAKTVGKQVLRTAGGGALVGGALGAGISAYRGGDAEDIAKGTAMGAAGGAAWRTFAPGMLGGAKSSPLYTSLARGATRGFALGSLAAAGSSLASKRQKDEGFFEAMGRRLGGATEAAAMYASPTTRAGGILTKAMLAPLVGQVAGMAADSQGYKGVGKALSSIPSISQIGAGAGKALDTASTGVRKLFGGGKSYSQVKSEALGKGPSLNQPRPQALEGQQFVHRPEYK